MKKETLELIKLHTGCLQKRSQTEMSLATQQKILADKIVKLFSMHFVSENNTCKQCKEPIPDGFRFCSGLCKEYYSR